MPTNPIQALLAQTSLERNLFTSTSRYYGMDTETLTTATGTTIIYVKRRFLPSTDSFQLLQLHAVVQGERLDNIAAKLLGDPELFWRIADANGAMRPEDLVAVVGRQLKITLPQGITGSAL
ncbi:MAG TPA: LysM domain-containing protein [Terracidiphilus sp.]|nr:LysM domain-containing protein [Terracidiphilus sp.]